MPEIVLIAESQIGSRSFPESPLEIAAQPQGRTIADQPDPGIPASIRFEDLRTCVLGVVVAKNQFGKGKGLSQQRIELFSQKAAAVMNGQNDTDCRSVSQKSPLPSLLSGEKS
jgi:hypothetical protein